MAASKNIFLPAPCPDSAIPDQHQLGYLYLSTGTKLRWPTRDVLQTYLVQRASPKHNGHKCREEHDMDGFDTVYSYAAASPDTHEEG